MLLRLEAVSLCFGARPLLDRVDLHIRAGERVCLIGRNGEGKSSLLRLASGSVQPDDGQVRLAPGTRVAMLTQDIADIVDVDGATVHGVVQSGLSAVAHDEPWVQAQRVTELLQRFGLDGAASYAQLSGGWRRRALLARALANDPNLLLLDEPTNHLDIEAIEWLEQALTGFAGALLFVSHDRAFINQIATRIVELDRGSFRSWQGNYDAYSQHKAEQLAIEAQQRALFDKKLAQEEVWIRKGIEARRTRNEGRVRALYRLREQHRARRERTGSAQLALQEGATSGKKVFDVAGASVQFPGRTVLQPFSTTIMRGDRVGIVGPNGSGKSTLIRLLLGELTPSSGAVRQGTRLEVAYYDQQRAALQLDRSVMENVSAQGDHVMINGAARHVASYLRDFLFRDEQLRTPAAALSGGERNKLLLARLFASPANLLVMDEPTNDLDIDTLELLEELVAEFSGTLLLVSHDRAFLDRVVTELLVVGRDGTVQEFVGGYSDWMAYCSAQQLAVTVQSATVAEAASAKVRRTGKSMSYREQGEFDAMPARIEALEAAHAQLAKRVGARGFYALDHASVAATLRELQQKSTEIEMAYARWAALEALRNAR